MNNTILDQRTKILQSRNVPYCQAYLSDDEKRRQKAYYILDHYYTGTSDTVLSLEQSLSENYIDVGLVNYLADKISTLTLHGFGLTNIQNSDAGDINKWLITSQLNNTLQASEVYASYLGDAYIKITYDYNNKTVVFIPIHPASVFKQIDGSIAIITQPSDIYSTELNIEHYKVENNQCYMRTGIVDSRNTVSTFNNNVNPVTLLNAEWQQLPISKLPIVHIPNNKHCDGYGTSDFSNVLDLIDIYNQIMTDKKTGCRFNALPFIFVAGQMVNKVDTTTGKINVKVSAGSWYDIGQNGTVTKIDNSNALDLLIKEETALFERIVRACGLSLAGIGYADSIGNMREYQIKLMYAPTIQTIEKKRAQRSEQFTNVLSVANELWQSVDNESYKATTNGSNLALFGFRYDDLLPVDLEAKIQILNGVKANSGISEHTYTSEVIKALGINSTVEQEMDYKKSEQSIMNM